MVKLSSILGCGLALLALATQVAGASSVTHQPLPIRSASLTQDARALVWRVRLGHPFSPAALARDRRSLCVLIERARNGTVAGQVCVLGSGSREGGPRLQYVPVTPSGPGRPRAIQASFTRTSASDMTASFLPASIGVPYSALRWQVLSTLRPPACVPPVPNRIGCYTLFPAKPALAGLHTPQVVGCVPSGPAFVYHGATGRRAVALTFDDGPWNDTARFLDVLEREHVHATFFEIGDQVATYGEGGVIERRMLADGDMIGDHTWSHPNVAGDGTFAATQIADTAAAIRRATGGFTPCLFRAPYGAVSSALISEARSMGFTTIQWDVDPRDWARPGVGAIYGNVVTNAHDGAIVIQHDGGGDRSETLAALPSEIHALRSKGYQFLTVTDLLGQRLVYK